MGDRRKSVKTAFIKQGHHSRLDQIIFMMGVGDLVAAHLQCFIVQCTLPKLGAEGTGIGFFPDIKENFSDFRRYELEFPGTAL